MVSYKNLLPNFLTRKKNRGDFLAQNLIFSEHSIVVDDDYGVQVMMDWEQPLMHKMAEIAALRRGHVLEVGFGMGISCDAVQKLKPKSHTILEAHPQIVERAKSWAQGKPNTVIVAGRWQDTINDVLAKHGPFDGISFDVFGGKGQREDFFSRLDTLLTPKGTATLWLADDGKMPETLAPILKKQKFCWQFHKVKAIPPPTCRYSQSNTFHLPVISRRQP